MPISVGSKCLSLSFQTRVPAIKGMRVDGYALSGQLTHQLKETGCIRSKKRHSVQPEIFADLFRNMSLDEFRYIVINLAEIMRKGSHYHRFPRIIDATGLKQPFFVSLCR